MAERCPHCGISGRFPNVLLAQQPEEFDALTSRYQLASEEAAKNGTEGVLRDFEKAIQNTQAVINRSAIDLYRLVQSDNQLYATYYQQIEAGIFIPEGSKWDKIRRVVDSALYENQINNIRFALLSLDGVGLSHYGECSIVLRTEMISHRASIFEENSIIFFERHGILVIDVDKLPVGYRSTWDERSKLCIAKLAKKLSCSTQPSDYVSVLLKEGLRSENDEFVEVHIWGPLTVRTIERVHILPKRKKASQVISKAIKEKLIKFGATVN
jgi:hypothetical protein